MTTDAPVIILGCGFIGTRLARAALAAGRPVRACARNIAKLAPLEALGAQLISLDATRPKAFAAAFHNARGALVVYALPQLAGAPAGETVGKATLAARESGVGTFIYLGSAGVYGKRPEDDRVIDETTATALDDSGMSAYHKDEAQVQGATSAGLRTVALRLPAVYGPGRGVRARLRKGDYELVDDGVHWISRIHVDDLVRIILAAEKKAPSGAQYLVGDDRPTPQREVAEYLANKLGVPLPPSVPLFGAGPPRTIRGRYIKNDLVKRELGLTLLYPSYIEGEAQLDEEESRDMTPA